MRSKIGFKERDKYYLNELTETKDGNYEVDVKSICKNFFYVIVELLM